MKLRKATPKPFDQDNGKDPKPTYPLTHVHRLISPQGQPWDVWEVSKEKS